MDTGRAEDDFYAGLERAGLHPLWHREVVAAIRGDNDSPQSEAPFHWPWRCIEPHLDRSIHIADVDNPAERRVLMLKNPAFDDMVCATNNIRINFQLVLPGERAKPHRHNINAIRFVLAGDGAETTVDGKRCPMEVGDLILTPGGAWHEHMHKGQTGRMIWLDALDAALVQRFRVRRYEHGPVEGIPDLPPDSALMTAGFLPARIRRTSSSPLFRYPWRSAIAALAAAPCSPDGSRAVRYINPVTGGAVLNRMDCYLVGLAKSSETQPCRTTSDVVCFVVEGAGVSHIAGNEISWEKYDTFTVPSWQWATHKSSSASSILLQISDREIMRRLDLLTEQTDVSNGTEGSA